MAQTLTTSRDLIGARLLAVVQGLSTAPDVTFWDDVEPDLDKNPPSPDSTWLRIEIRPTGGTQVSISTGGQGTGKFRRTGLVTARIYTPIRDGLRTSDDIVQEFLDGLEGRDTGGVWFENVRAVGRGRVNQWTEQRVVADYYYDANK